MQSCRPHGSGISDSVTDMAAAIRHDCRCQGFWKYEKAEETACIDFDKSLETSVQNQCT